MGNSVIRRLLIEDRNRSIQLKWCEMRIAHCHGDGLMPQKAGYVDDGDASAHEPRCVRVTEIVQPTIRNSGPHPRCFPALLEGCNWSELAFSRKKTGTIGLVYVPGCSVSKHQILITPSVSGHS